MGSENTTQEIKLEDFEIKEETVSIKEKDPLGSNEEDTCTCTVYVQGESLKRESTDIQSKTNNCYFIILLYNVIYTVQWCTLSNFRIDGLV